jgi:hypothetical protein
MRGSDQCLPAQNGARTTPARSKAVIRHQSRSGPDRISAVHRRPNGRVIISHESGNSEEGMKPPLNFQGLCPVASLRRILVEMGD